MKLLKKFIAECGRRFAQTRADAKNLSKNLTLADAMRYTVVILAASLCTTEVWAQSSAIAAGGVIPGVTNVVCSVTNTIRGPYLFGGGLALITMGGVAIASSESTIFKLMSGSMVGLGIAAAGLPILNMVGVNTGCSGLLNT